MGVVDSCIDDADQYALTGKIKQRLILKLQDAGSFQGGGVLGGIQAGNNVIR